MITDYGDITDESFNQTTYEASKALCEPTGVELTYYTPAGDTPGTVRPSPPLPATLSVPKTAIPRVHRQPNPT